MDASELKSYGEFLNEVDKKRQGITQQLDADTQQGDFWATALSWRQAAPKFEDLHASMVAYTPPVDIVNEHRELITNDEGLLGAINITLSSANFDSKTVNDILFKAGQSKMESANQQVQETIQQMKNKIQELLGQ